MPGKVTNQFPSLSRRILATTRSFIAHLSVTIVCPDKTPGHAQLPEASPRASPDLCALARWSCICRRYTQLSRDSLAGEQGLVHSVLAGFSGELADRSRVHRSRQYICGARDEVSTGVDGRFRIKVRPTSSVARRNLQCMCPA